MIHTASSPVERRLAAPDSDIACVRAAKAGQFGAFEELVNRYERRIYRLGLKITANPADAEEVLQETFLKAFVHLREFREDSRFYTWLARIAINEGLMKLRKQRSDKSVPVEDFVNEDGGAVTREFADGKPDPEEVATQSELRAMLLKAIGSLPFGSRVVFVLRDVEGFTPKETAEMLRLTEQVVKSRLFRAHMRLRKILSKTLQPGSPAMAGAMRD
ncbi:MAG: sigma-70 family RNA polymerase sigma factor [Acidobacteria bacterium]|nr:MAG: sigma-70 family RNA polymerase sigma factor [Acidobacteriota bacterium]